MVQEQRILTGFQLRRMGFPQESRYSMVKRLYIGDLFVGRYQNPTSNQLNLVSTYVSKNHCRIECRPNGQIFLHDISSNGTFVNGVNYKQTSIELRDKDRIGVGFPVNENNAMNGKSFFGFVLERVENEIKQEIKEEMRDDQDTDNELVIDENFRSRSVTPHSQPSILPIPIQIPEPPVAVPVQQNGFRITNCVSLSPNEENDPVIAQVRQEDDDLGIDIKEELIKRELEDDMGTFTDDDEVEYVSTYKLDPSSNSSSSMPFKYIEQLSEATISTDEESHQSSTQTLLNDLLGSDSNETTPAVEQPVENETTPVVQEEPVENVPLIDKTLDKTRFKAPQPPKSAIKDPKPSTSRAHTNDSSVPSDAKELLKTMDLDSVLNFLAEFYGVDKLMKAFKEIKGEMIKNDDPENPKDKKEKKKSHKNHKRPSNHKNVSKSKGKSSHDKPKEVPKPEKDRYDTLKEAQKPEKERRNSLEKPSTSSNDPKSLDKRRKSAPIVSVEPEQIPENFSNEDEQHSPLQMYDEPEILNDNRTNSRQNSIEEPEQVAPETPAGVKRKADDIVSPGFHTEKRRNKADFSDSLKNLRPVPDPVPIEDLYSASQLPPPLEVVPEAKEPDFKNKLFNKVKERKAHNREEKKESNKQLKHKSQKKVDNKKKDTPKIFKIPKVTYKANISTERRDSVSSDDGLKAFMNEVDQVISSKPQDNGHNQEPRPSRDPRQKKENIPENISNKPLVASTPHKFAVPHAPDTRPSLDVPPSPFLSAETFNRECQQRKTGALSLRRQSLDVPPSPFLSSDPSLQRETPAIDVTSVIPYNCKDILSDVLSWEVDWIGSEDAPIVENQKTLLSVSYSFPSYGHYVNTMVPLLKLELFHSIVEAYPRKIIKPPTKAKLINNNGDYNNKFNNSKLISIQVEVASQITREDWFHNFRQGTLIVITTLRKEQFFGYISHAKEQKERVTLSILVSNKFPFVQTLKHQFDICFVEYIKVEMETFLMLKDLKNSPLLNLVLKPNLISYNKNVSSPKYHGKEKLNEHQFMAMSQVTVNIDANRNKPHVFLIEGPPGTGKSRLIASIIMQFVRSTENKNKDFRILLCAPSNNAVDVLTEKLISYRNLCQRPEDRRMLKIVRFGEKIGIKIVNEYSIASLLEAEVDREYTKIANQFQNDTEEQKERQALISEIKELYNKKRKPETTSTELHAVEKEVFELKLKLREIEKKMYFKEKTRREREGFRQRTRSKLLDGANIVASTLTSLPSLYNNCCQKFDIAIIDEATQATETATLMTLSLGVRHLVMVGDTKQLPALIRNQKAKELGLGTSLFARMRAVSDNFLNLRKQYRMDPEILKFSNAYFYNNMIENGTVVYQKDSYKLKPYLVFELESEQNMTQNPHFYNTDEIDFVINLLRTITGLLQSQTYSIGVVTPYAKQKQLIEKKLSQDFKPNISVYTIDAIQGQEKDIIVFSCVRTEGVGFLSSPERLNVALTRAKKSLFICGNFMSLRRVDIWDRLLTDAENRGVFIDEIYDLPKHLLR